MKCSGVVPNLSLDRTQNLPLESEFELFLVSSSFFSILNFFVFATTLVGFILVIAVSLISNCMYQRIGPALERARQRRETYNPRKAMCIVFNSMSIDSLNSQSAKTITLSPFDSKPTPKSANCDLGTNSNMLLPNSYLTSSWSSSSNLTNSRQSNKPLLAAAPKVKVKSARKPTSSINESCSLRETSKDQSQQINNSHKV